MKYPEIQYVTVEMKSQREYNDYLEALGQLQKMVPESFSFDGAESVVGTAIIIGSDDPRVFLLTGAVLAHVRQPEDYLGFRTVEDTLNTYPAYGVYQSMLAERR